MNNQTLSFCALGLSIAATIVATTGFVMQQHSTCSVAVVDAKAVMEAKKLVLLASLRGRDGDMAHLEKTVVASQRLPQMLEDALNTLSKKYGVTLLDKGAVLTGESIEDLTDELYRLMEVTPNEAAAARMAIGRSTFGK